MDRQIPFCRFHDCKLNMRTELNLMSHLDVMLSMDSANMHLASLVNIPVVSIWARPIQYAGFIGVETTARQYRVN